MARTKASVGSKVSSGKSSKARCSVAPPSSSGGSSGGGDKASRNHSGGGNPMCQRETPKWQRPITNFFICKDPQVDRNLSDNEDEAAAGSSKSKPKRNIIQSDDEDEQQNEEDQQKPAEDGEEPTTNGEGEQTETNEALTNGELNEIPTNHVLDETIELEPLSGENSHKIDEYYSKNAKGKGVGKKTKGKENLDVNVEKRNSLKRDLEEVTFGEDSPQVSKKVKVN